MDIVLQTNAALITHKAGAAPAAVVSFAGVGRSSEKIQQPEFVETLNNTSFDGHVFHVTDAQRYWYNETAESIVGALQPRLQPFPRVTALGNSMGGFGALYFASRLPHCRRAVAFAPQFSLAPGFLPSPDKRWKGFTQRIPRHVIDHAMVGAIPTIDFVMFFGADDPADGLHAGCFMEFPLLPITIFFVNSCGHEVARFIREKGGLPQLVDLLITQDSPADAVQGLFISLGISGGVWRSPAAQAAPK